MVGLGCREDPCEQSRCFFVDSAAGDDDGPGTREDPWETLGRGLQHFEGADPGDHVLLRRGRTFQGDHAVASVVGAPDAPLVVGAYGPIDEPRPRVVDANVRLSDSEHLVLRDLELVGTGGDPCLFVARSGYLTVRDSEIRDCGLRAARIGEESHHTVMFRNEILDVGNKTAIFISDTNWSTPPATIGLHHWIAGNRITNNGEHAVDVGFDAALREGDEVGDIKIVGNEIVDVDRAIRMHAPGTWVLGNVVAGVPDPAIPVDGISVQQPGSGHVEYNVVTGTSRALNVAAPAYVGQNSLLQAVAADAVVNVAFAAQGASFTNNVVFTQGTAMLDTLAAVVEDLDALDGNAYAGGSCLFRLDGVDLEFSSWQTSTGVDTLSRCEPVPGLSVPAEFATVDAAFWDAVTPSEAWEGCGAIGAIDCSGERRPLIFQPQDAVGEDGVGWRGPLIIQQHYPLEP